MDFDLVIAGANLIDGTGAPAVRADVGVAAGRIAAVGDLARATAARRIVAEGVALAPGFIDAHTHDDRLLLSDPAMAPKASQGVTTVVAGNCGISLAPIVAPAPPAPLTLLGGGEWFVHGAFASYAARLERTPPALNALLLVGHTTLRAGAMDALDRPASAAEIAAMQGRLAEALDAGAAGLSSGLFYAPARAAPTAEVIALAQVAGKRGGLYATHLRDEADRIDEALEEAFAIGRASGAKVVLSHHKVQGTRNFGHTRHTLARIREVQAQQPVALDVYPYAASSTVLNRESVGRAARTLIAWSTPHPELAGRTLEDAAQALGLDQDAAIEALQPAGGIYFAMDEADVRRVLAFPKAMIGSDGLPHDARPHPRLWGSFPRVLGHYAREVGLFSLEEAVRRMTALPAEEFGIPERGRIAPGLMADLVLFDPAAVIDRAGYDDPLRPAEGIREVFVAGESIWREGAPTGARPGRVLRRQGMA